MGGVRRFCNLVLWFDKEQSAVQSARRQESRKQEGAGGWGLVRRKPLRRLLRPRGPVSSAAPGCTARVGKAATPSGSERRIWVGARRRPDSVVFLPAPADTPLLRVVGVLDGPFGVLHRPRPSWLVLPGNHLNPAAERAFLMTQPSVFPACLIFKPFLYPGLLKASVHHTSGMTDTSPELTGPRHSRFPKPHRAGFADVFRLGEWAPQFTECAGETPNPGQHLSLFPARGAWWETQRKRGLWVEA